MGGTLSEAHRCTKFELRYNLNDPPNHLYLISPFLTKTFVSKNKQNILGKPSISGETFLPALIFYYLISWTTFLQFKQSFAKYALLKKGQISVMLVLRMTQF